MGGVWGTLAIIWGVYALYVAMIVCFRRWGH